MDDSLKEEFFIEAFELIDEAEVALMNLDKGMEFQSNFNLTFRAFHSLKGGAGMFEIVELQGFVHNIETHISNKEEAFFTKNKISFLLECLDEIKNFLEGNSYNFNRSFELTDHVEEKSIADKDVPHNTEVQKEAVEKTPESSKSSDVSFDKSSEKISINEEEIKKFKDGLIYAVDDEEDIVEMISVMLEDAGDFEIQTFTNPLAAKKAFSERNPDLVITDLSMPEMTGLQLLNELKSLNQIVPVIILSGYVTKESCISALRDGASGILEKPCTAVELQSQVKHNIQKYKAFKLFNQSVDLLVENFEDFHEFLKSKDELSASRFRKEIKELLIEKRDIHKKSA